MLPGSHHSDGKTGNHEIPKKHSGLLHTQQLLPTIVILHLGMRSLNTQNVPYPYLHKLFRSDDPRQRQIAHNRVIDNR